MTMIGKDLFVCLFLVVVDDRMFHDDILRSDGPRRDDRYSFYYLSNISYEFWFNFEKFLYRKAATIPVVMTIGKILSVEVTSILSADVLAFLLFRAQ